MNWFRHWPSNTTVAWEVGARNLSKPESRHYLLACLLGATTITAFVSTLQQLPLTNTPMPSCMMEMMEEEERTTSYHLCTITDMSRTRDQGEETMVCGKIQWNVDLLTFSGWTQNTFTAQRNHLFFHFLTSAQDFTRISARTRSDWTPNSLRAMRWAEFSSSFASTREKQ